MTLQPTWRHRRAATHQRTLDRDLVLDSALAPRVASVAGGLRARGVRRGDTVSWQLPNVADTIVMYRACWRIGAVAAPLHHQAGETDAAAMLRAVGGDAHLIEPDEVDALARTGTPVPAGTRGGPRPADLAVALFTSGSTGEPKAVLHTHRGLAYKGHLMARVHGLTGADCVLMPAPLAHISGLLNAILVPGAVGMRVLLMAKWDPEAALDIIERERVSFMIGPPTFFVALMHAPGFTPARVASMRLISSGGAGVSPAFVGAASEQFGCTVKRTYGSTEAPTVTTSFAGDPPERARETDGRPVGEVEVRLAGNGELLVRGPELFVGYGRQDQTDAAVDHGWFHTGDLARIDPDGWVTITGRIKDIIIRGGENIAVSEVEAIVEAHPLVRQAVAIGEPDPRLGERVAVVVVGDAGFDLDACREWFAARGVARFKTPERVVVVDSIPVLAAGKPDRAALRRILTTGA